MIIILLLFWFLLSGQTSVFFIVSALFSVFAVFFIVRNLFNYSSWIIGIKIQWVIFILKLLKEIALSTLQVTRIIWTKPKLISPTTLWIKSDFSNQINQVILANAITLTPGTMSMDIKNGNILVHSLTSNASFDKLKNLVVQLEK